jgi:prophage regulatory protein
MSLRHFHHHSLAGDEPDRERHVLREPQVFERTKLSRVQRWRRVRAGTFPAPVELGPNSIGWWEDEIEGWLASRPRVSYAPRTDSDATPIAQTPSANAVASTPRRNDRTREMSGQEHSA